jgi:hypothetical protein
LEESANIMSSELLRFPADSEILREIRELPVGGAAALAKLSPIGY